MTSKTQYFVAASLDGFIADEHDRIDWLLAFDGTPGLREHYEAFLADVGALAMGSRTYAFLLEHGGAWPYAERPCYVFTRRELPAIAGANLRFVRGELAPLRAELLAAAGGKHLWLVGGGALAAQFQSEGMLDELWLSVMPLVLGGGARLFGSARVPALQLQGVTPFQRGIVELRYALT
jgi:dihydrofolate reductase